MFALLLMVLVLVIVLVLVVVLVLAIVLLFLFLFIPFSVCFHLFNEFRRGLCSSFALFAYRFPRDVRFIWNKIITSNGTKSAIFE